MRIISYIANGLKCIINNWFYSSKDQIVCKNCRHRSNKDVMVNEFYSYARSLKESCTYFCTRHNRYVSLEDTCHDYDRD
ncbi:MAG: hypothetical protein J6B87_05680 [Clostridia bacterium]|nr:hypothetical protein [Clostridia bacterium]